MVAILLPLLLLAHLIGIVICNSTALAVQWENYTNTAIASGSSTTLLMTTPTPSLRASQTQLLLTAESSLSGSAKDNQTTFSLTNASMSSTPQTVTSMSVRLSSVGMSSTVPSTSLRSTSAAATTVHLASSSAPTTVFLTTTSVVSPPESPANVSVIATSANVLHVSWSLTRGAFYYRVVCIQCNVNVTTNASSIELTYLTPGTKYSVSIAACSKSSVCSTYSQTFPECYCYLVMDFAALSVSIFLLNRTTSSLSLQWNQTDDIDGDYLLSVNGSRVTLPWNVTATTITNLTTPGALYCVTLTVLHGNLTRSTSERCLVTLPAQTRNLVLKNITGNSISVEWFQDGIFDSLVFSLDGGSFSNIGYQQNGSWCRANIGNLSIAGGSYVVALAAVSGDAQGLVQSITAITVPPQPSVVSCDTSSSFVIVISPPSVNSFRIESYFILLEASTAGFGGNHNITVPYSVNGSSANFSRAVPGVTYHVKVYSVVSDVISDPKFQSCTAVASPVSSLVVDDSLTPRLLYLSWNTPTGFTNGFIVNCVSMSNNAVNVTAVISSTKTMSTYNYNCSNLTAGAQYSVFVNTISSSNASVASNIVNISTAPLPPVLKVLPFNYSTILVTLIYPFVPSVSQCSYYLVTTRPGSVWRITCDDNITLPLPALIDSTYYGVNVIAISDQGRNSSESSDTIWTLPKPVIGFMALASMSDSLSIAWNTTETKPTITGYELTINSSDNMSCLKSVLINCSLSIAQEFTECTQTTISRTMVIPCNSTSISYTFSGLLPATNYSISAVVLNPGGRSVSQSITTVTGSTTKPQSSTVTAHVTVVVPLEQSGCDGGCIAGIVIGVILAIVLIIVIVYVVWKYRHPTPKRMQRSSLIGMGAANPAFLPFEPVEDTEKPPSPVLVSDFTNHVQDLHKDSGYKFSAEYEQLKRLSKVHPQTAAELPRNRVKNRYTNILPYDHSRVKLIPTDDDDEGSDYINASYVPGYFSKREFIATQGPMKCTLDDFWRMIWEQNVSSVVMLTNLQERSREKCECYWPLDSDPLYYGDVQVQVKSESSLGHYVIRVMEVRVDSKRRIVKQMHFNSWPDFGCPKDVDQLLDFVQSVRSQMSGLRTNVPGPILVHCSAGVGRTGTFIVIDRLLQQIQREHTVDVFGTTLEMREYRCHMIQTEAQYVFTHDCLTAAIERGVHFGKPLDGNSNSSDEEQQMYANVSRVQDTNSPALTLSDRSLLEGSDNSVIQFGSPPKRPQPAPRNKTKKDQTTSPTAPTQINLLDL